MSAAACLRYSCMMLLMLVSTAVDAQRLTAAVASKPTISSILPTHCVKPGAKIVITGKGFSSKGQRLGLKTGAGMLLLMSRKWSATKIETTVPRSDKIETGKSYPVLIIEARTQRVISNRDKRLQICSSTATLSGKTLTRQTQKLTKRAPVRERQLEYKQAQLQRTRPTKGEMPEAGKKRDDNYEAGEVIILSKNMADARKLAAMIAKQGYRIKRRRSLKHLGYVLNVVSVPKKVKVADALKRFRQRDKSLLIDANHRYRLQGTVADKNNQVVHQAIGWGQPNSNCGKGIKLGIIDSLVDTSYPGFRNQQINNKSFLPSGFIAADKQHATAIASILVSQPNASVMGLLPAAKVYAAGVFRQTKAKQIETTAELIVSGLNWLHGKGVDAINLSIAGPRNRLLEVSIRHLLKQNTLIAAAVGNNGLENVEMYPAAIEGVAAVTAVDARNRIYKQANRGKFVMFAAPGVDVWAARNGHAAAFVSGTSYATPYITAALAVVRQRDTALNASRVISQLIEKTKDLGDPGRDMIFGQGLLQFNGCQ